MCSIRKDLIEFELNIDNTKTHLCESITGWEMKMTMPMPAVEEIEIQNFTRYLEFQCYWLFLS